MNFEKSSIVPVILCCDDTICAIYRMCVILLTKRTDILESIMLESKWEKEALSDLIFGNKYSIEIVRGKI